MLEDTDWDSNTQRSQKGVRFFDHNQTDHTTHQQPCLARRTMPPRSPTSHLSLATSRAKEKERDKQREG